MLIRLLRLLFDSEGVVTIREVSRTMGITEGMMKDMVDLAVGLGYLAHLHPDCSKAPCPVCRERSSCLLGTSARVWSLTDRGMQLLSESRALEVTSDGRVENARSRDW